MHNKWKETFKTKFYKNSQLKPDNNIVIYAGAY
jgi:hypothetical protein